ncbi:g161 [Coccomyxa viridis]|uniref:G161 protein n=1 Tax=Coccomyxa viridis TaxID=1274662 RepID=A0ABP1FF94_9CHLO
MAAAQSPSAPAKALCSTKDLSHPHKSDDEDGGEAIEETFAALAGEDGIQVSIETLRSILQDFDLKIDLEESLQKLQDSKPRRAHFNEPLEALTLEDFSSLFN